MKFAVRPYRFEAKDGRAVEAELGSLAVPMNRSEPGRGTVQLAFVRLPASVAKPGPPIVFLNGGPGLSGIESARGRLFAMFEAFCATADVVLLDQRGSGFSTPSLACDDALVLPFDRVLSKADVLRALDESTRRCAERLRKSGVDLSAFNTSESADDVADLAGALGAESVSLLAWSYGTHLAFAVLRRHESIVARVVLAAPEGPDHTYKLPSRIQRQLESLSDRARAATPKSPKLVASMRAVLEQVEREPVRIPWSDSDPQAAVVGRFDLEWTTAQGIGDTRILSRLPRWYARMARGNFGDIARDRVLRAYFEELRTGMNRSLVRTCMDCASGATAERWRRIENEARTTLLGRTADFPFPEICDAIGNPDLGDGFRAPVRSSKEVLFITGTLDARTPADNVAELAPGFSRHRHLVVEDAGHSDLLFPAAAQRAIAGFFSSGEVENERVRVEPSFRFEHDRPVLLYDGECGFCLRQVERLRARVGDAVAFEAYQEAHWVNIRKENLAQSVHLVDGDGSVSSGTEAVFRTLAAGGKHRLLYSMYRRLPAFAAVSEAVYRWIARHRGRLARVFPRS